MIMKYELPIAKKIEIETVDIIATSLEELPEVLVTWGAKNAEVDSKQASIFET
ncbi:MAG: hypothetical protein IKU61_07590 [Clostridia bacterium]|nr:hypothetical protein [Clostridia bacterium]